MAANSPYFIPVPPLGDAALTQLVIAGQKWNALVCADIDEMDRELQSTQGQDPNGEKFQRLNKGPSFWTAWTEHNTTGTVGNTFETLTRILGTLPVGRRDQAEWQLHGLLPWEVPRMANTRLFPQGPNIRISMIQDKPYSGTNPPTGPNPPTGAYYESIYNVIDGIIISTGAQYPQVNPRLLYWQDFSDLTWAMWNRLHSAGAKAANSYGVGFHGDGLGGTWKGSQAVMFKDFSPVPGDSLSPNHDLTKRMKPFLNYIIQQGITSQPTVAAVMRCLGARRVSEGYLPMWKQALDRPHQTFRIGHWAFYALLATDSGVGVVRLLSEHKSNLQFDLKMLKSVTITMADITNGLSAPDFEKYVHWPTLIWEVVDTQARKPQLLNGARNTETKWFTAPQTYNFCEIPQTALGT